MDRGTSEHPSLVFFSSLRHIIGELVGYGTTQPIGLRCFSIAFTSHPSRQDIGKGFDFDFERL